MSNDTPEERAATISVKGAILVAVLTLLGSVVISAMGGVITAWQVHENGDQTQTDFLRTQRQIQYGKVSGTLVAIDQCLSGVHSEYLHEHTVDKKIDRSKLRDMFKPCNAKQATLNDDLGPLLVVAPSYLASQVQIAVMNSSSNCANTSMYINSQDINVAVSRYYDSNAKATKSRDTVIYSMRKDLVDPSTSN